MLRTLLLVVVFVSFVTQSLGIPSQVKAELVRRDAPPPQSTACGDIVRDAGVNTFKASLVNECLTSVPFHAGVSAKFLQYYRDSVQFHSTLDLLKNPPSTYRQPAVDVLARLDELQTRVNSNQFENQYEFEAALQSIVLAVHDDHFSLEAGILGVFSFGTSYRIATVSSDGIELPKIYLTTDLIRADKENYEASPIVKLDDRDAVEYLTEFAARNSQGGRESHTDWNSLMINPAQVIQSIPSVWGGGATFFPGDILKIELLNKTVIKSSWYGVFHGDSETGPLETGGDFYNSFVLGFYPSAFDPPEDDEDAPVTVTETTPTATSSSSSNTSTLSAAAPKPSKWKNSAYPQPDLAQEDLEPGGGFLSAYYLNDPKIAVLSVPGFQQSGDAIENYSEFVTTFIKETQKRKVDKVVIDVQRNFGGDALLAFDMFKQFFPAKDLYAGSRLRAHEPANIVGSTLTEYWDAAPEDDSDHIYLYINEFVASTRINSETNETFSSWEEFYGPRLYSGGSFTVTQRYNLSDELFDTIATESSDEGFTVYGYGRRPAKVNQPFAADDIVILTDGLCSSACAIFVEMMHHEAGVKTVVAGGRPQYGPMQAIGLSRGASHYSVVHQLDSDITDAQIILNFNNQSSNFLPDRADALDVEVTHAGINLRDQVRKNDPIALQFKYDAADCRIFFTHKTIFNYTALWQHAAAAAWTRPELCVKDSTGYAKSTAEDTTLPPASVLPPTTKIETPPMKVGALIKSFMDPKSGIEAGSIPKKGETPKVNHTGKICSATKACPKNYFCDLDYASCDEGKKVFKAGCVKMCQHTSVNKKCGDKTSTCTAMPEDSETQLDDTGRGYCSTPFKSSKKKCTTSQNTKVTPGKPSKPGKK